MSTRTAARAIRDHVDASHRRQRNVLRARVTGVKPLRVELVTSGLVLDEDDDFGLSGGLDAYDDDHKIKTGDTLLLLHEAGDYTAFDVESARRPKRIKATDLDKRVKKMEALKADHLELPGAYTNPTRTFATDYQPSLTRPTFVLLTLFIGCANAEGAINIFCAAGAPPATQIGKLEHRNLTAASNSYISVPVGFMVPPGFRYRLTTSTTSGTPAYAVSLASETTL